jgi:TolB-like protein/Tfp pilus assembly protein PilF
VLVGLNVAGLRERLLGGVAPGQITSIAVLPLENMMGDSEQDYFVAGMHEALITELSKIGALTVISRTSAMRYRNTDKSVPEIARELGVDALIEGSVLRAGNQVRITAQLIEAATDRNLWADNFDRELRDILALHSEVARAIAREIKIAVTPEETRRLASARPVNPEAYEAYLKGWFHLYKLTPESLDIALQYFELALEKDPNYALAYVGIAETLGTRGHIGLVPPREAFPKTKAAALKAIELDDTLGEAHDILANVRFYLEWDWPAAEREYRRAIELNPNYAEVRRTYSLFLASTGRREEALAEMERCLELDPHNSLFQFNFGLRLLELGRYDAAIAQLQKVLRTDPNFAFGHRGLWAAFHQKRMYEEAVAEAKKFFALRGDSEVAEVLARGYAQGGYAGAMRRAAEKLAARSKLTYVQPTRVAHLYANAGEKERALDWLEKAYQERNSQLVYINVAPQWDSLRDDARFQDLLRRMNFPEN